MSKIRKQIYDLLRKSKLTERQIKTLSQECHDLDTKIRDLRSKLILDEGVLKNHRWELCMSSADDMYLSSSMDDDKLLLQLTGGYNHGYIQLPFNDVVINFSHNDSDLSLGCDDPMQLVYFANEQDLKVKVSGIEEKISKWRKKCAALERAVHLFSK